MIKELEIKVENMIEELKEEMFKPNPNHSKMYKIYNEIETLQEFIKTQK